jgi:cytochrome P450
MDVTGTDFSPEFMFDHPDPYPMFAMLRQSQPVLRAEFRNRIAWVLTKYDDCFAVLKDAETYSSRSNAEVGKIMGRTVIEMDSRPVSSGTSDSPTSCTRRSSEHAGA